MCGIFGYIGTKTNAAQIVLEGLKILEYRGYDSWGIAVKSGNKLTIEKHIGKIGGANTILPKSSLGIGHTRWATHGGVTVANAHPHLDCSKKIAVVHNGIVENHSQLTKYLTKVGHKFLSETDTEVVSHLIEENLKKTHEFSEAVRLAYLKLNGLNAIVALDVDSQEIVAAKNGSPLIIGRAKNDFFIASDASAIIPYTRKLLFLEDNKMVVINKQVKVSIIKNGSNIRPTFEEIDWKVEEAEIGKYKHFMIKEIHDQSKVLRNIAKNYEKEITILSNAIKNARGTFFIGVGTAFNACLEGSYFFSKIAKLHINPVIGSEFNYLEDFITKKSLVIAFSQSGETIDVIEPLNRVKSKGAKIAALVNVLGSTIYRSSDIKVLLAAGPEKAVASTKAFTAKLAMIFLLAYKMVGKQKIARLLLLDTAREVERLCSKKSIDGLKKIAKILSKSNHIYVIGRGASYPVALEAALKIKEVSYIHTEGFAGGELKHGPIALIDSGTPVIVFAPNDETYESIISNATEIKSRGGLIVGIGAEKSDVFDHFIEVKDLGEASSIAQVVPAQLISYYITLEKKYDPDKPRNLAKSVTVK